MSREHQFEAVWSVILLGLVLVIVGGRGLMRGAAAQRDQRPARAQEKYQPRHVRPRGYVAPVRPAPVMVAVEPVAAPTIAAPTVMLPPIVVRRPTWDASTTYRPGWRNIAALVAPSASPLAGWRSVAMSR